MSAEIEAADSEFSECIDGASFEHTSLHNIVRSMRALMSCGHDTVHDLQLFFDEHGCKLSDYDIEFLVKAFCRGVPRPDLWEERDGIYTPLPSLDTDNIIYNGH